MAALITPLCDFGQPAADFRLADAEGRIFTLGDVRGVHATLLMFICNHCPYVRAIIDRLVDDCRLLQAEGIGVIAIMPNDYRRYPDDAPAKMRDLANRHHFPFPYVIDETQDVARAYGAVCTPDFFGFNADLGLQYRGRFDDAGMSGAAATRHELRDAMRQIAATGQGPREQQASMGCSIKWRTP